MKRFFKYSTLTILLGLLAFFTIPDKRYMLWALIYKQVNVDDYLLFQNRLVKKGNPEPWKVSKEYNSFNFNSTQLKYLADTKTIAYLVIKDTSILSETYWGGYSKNSYSNSFSMAKSIIGMLVGCALDDGSIKSLDQKVCDYIPEYSEGNKSKITIRHLLDMSSGLRWEEASNTYQSPDDQLPKKEKFFGGDSYSNYNGLPIPVNVMPEHKESGKSSIGLLLSVCTQGYYGNNLEKLVFKMKSFEEAGNFFDYRSGNTQLLAMVLEKATGETISDYASERIWSKIGAEYDAHWSLDRMNGHEKAFCCFNSNARDFARIGQLMLNGGQWHDHQIIPNWYVKESTTPDEKLFDIELLKPNNRYALHWWFINYKNCKIFYARGTLGQYIFVIPDRNALIVRLGEYRNDLIIDGHPEDVYKFLDMGFSIIDRN